ncbi:golgi-body localization protein domain-containing protein [Lipomyces oligophaga]|uniref:golgi-body localization protein domain-containing protein n=1 Tax=Lipomyces oligophaga TaxID=45792 RepID=UPI0034CDB0C3
MQRPEGISLLIAELFVLLIFTQLVAIVFFAVVRIFTGISIQRLGYFSLRHITFTLPSGAYLEISKVEINFHRPAFSRPSWITFTVADISIYLDHEQDQHHNSHLPTPSSYRPASVSDFPPQTESTPPWIKALQLLKTQKRRILKFILFADFNLRNVALISRDVGKMRVRSIALYADLLDPAQAFSDPAIVRLGKDVIGANWVFAIKDVFYESDHNHAEQLLDLFLLNIQDMSLKSTMETKDLVVNLRVGNLTIPFDSYSSFHRRLRERRKLRHARLKAATPVTSASSATNISKYSQDDFVGVLYSLVDTVREVRVHVSKAGIYRLSPQDKYKQLSFSMSTKEFTVDIRRLNQNSPGHRMLFPVEDISHQAIMTAVAITVGIDDFDTDFHDELVYIPMIAATCTTNLLRKALDIYTHATDDRNSSLLKGSLTITSPAIDVRARHLQPFLAILSTLSKQQDEVTVSAPVAISISGKEHSRPSFVQLLPRTMIKLNIEEPGSRIKVTDGDLDLPIKNERRAKFESFDKVNGLSKLIAANCSIIHCEIESSHSITPHPNYSLTLALRVADFKVWARGEKRHDLLKASVLGLRIAAGTSPSLDVSLNVSLHSFALYLTNQDTIDNLKELISHIRTNIKTSSDELDPGKKVKKAARKAKETAFDLSHSKRNSLMSIPPWLSHMHLEGSEVVLGAATQDTHPVGCEISHAVRGVAVKIESWIVQYKPNIPPGSSNSRRRPPTRPSGLRTDSVASLSGSEFLLPTNKSTSSKVETGRRQLAIGLCGLEASTIDEVCNILDPSAPVFTIPDIEMALTGYIERGQTILEFNLLLRKMTANYSLFNHYSILLAVQAFKTSLGIAIASASPSKSKQTSKDLVFVDVRTHHIRVKFNLPHADPLLLDAVGLDFSKRSHAVPLLKLKYFRVFTQAPSVSHAWERLLVFSHLRVELQNDGKNQPAAVESQNEKLDSEHLKDDISVTMDSLSVSIPSGLVLYKTMDDVVTTTKAIKQLSHQFIYHSSEYVLAPQAKKPVRVPRVRATSRIIEIRLDDDPFEARLSLIFTVGMIEMQSRLAREAAFEAKVEALQTAGQNLEGKPGGKEDLEVMKPPKKRATFRSMKGMKHKHRDKLRSGSGGGANGIPIRYSPKEAEMPSASASISTELAYEKLKELHSQSWIYRITKARRIRAHAVATKRNKMIGADEVESDLTSEMNVIAIPDSPPLFQMMLFQPDILIDKPSFDLIDVHKFLHTVGKGIPEETQYSLLVPLFIQIDMDEFRIILRDYPLPLFHVPAIKSMQVGDSRAWSLKSDCVIAEELFDESSNRYIQCPIARGSNHSDRDYILKVTRTISAVKLYSNMDINIATADPTRITWAPSIQPAIQAVMMIFDTFTKPPVDPSPKVGFWDKLRLIFHSKIRFHWCDGAVHLLLKGSRDPYEVTGAGSGFAMCWENNVVFDVNPSDDQREFMRVDSNDFLLAIPDFSYYVRQMQVSDNAEDTTSTLSSASDYSSKAQFLKVVMKLSGNVQWKAGLLFERNLGDGFGRTFESAPHYQVQLRRPNTIDPSKPYDAYSGFRSDYIHLALSVISPRDAAWDPSQPRSKSTSINSIHLTPLTFMHFFKWWDLFGDKVSLPVRTGKLFPPIMISKKFGRHLASIKYQFVLQPFFISHSYLYRKEDDAPAKGTNAVGIKGRVASFMMDLHQRREFYMYTDKVLNVQRKQRRMRMNIGEVDFQEADIRGVTATFKDRTPEELVTQIGNASVFSSEPTSPTRSSGNIPPLARLKVWDNDLTWVDIDDFTELESFVGNGNLSSVRVIPWMFTPRFTYYRQTEHKHEKSNDSNSSEVVKPFGNEPSHICLQNQTDTIRFQTELIAARAQELEKQIEVNKQQMEEYRRQARLSTESSVARQRFINAKKDAEMLEYKRHTLHQLWISLLQSTGHISRSDLENSICRDPEEAEINQNLFGDDKFDVLSNLYDLRALEDEAFSDFNNRFIFHNVQIRWNNSIRNAIFNYIHQIGHRKGLVYYMSRRAIKFIDDLDKEKKKFAASKQTEVTDVDSAMSDIGSGRSQAKSDVDPDLEEILTRSTSRVTAHQLLANRQRQATENMISDLLADHEHFVVSDETKPVRQPGTQNHEHEHHHHHHHLHLHNSDTSSSVTAGENPRIDGAQFEHVPMLEPASSLSPISTSLNGHSDPPSVSNLSNASTSEDTSTNEYDHESSGTSTDSDSEDLSDIQSIFEDGDQINHDVLQNLAERYIARSSYVIRLLGPQIQLQSETNPDATLIVTSQNIELKIISIMDKNEIEDDVSGLVQSRYSANLDNAQFFVFQKEEMRRQSHWLFSSSLYGGTRLNSAVGLAHYMPVSAVWPPWVPVETIYDGCALKDNMITERTSSSLSYDKHNSLRLKTGDRVVNSVNANSVAVTKEIDQLSVDFPKFVTAMDSQQYYSLYMIIMDVLIYSEPHSKKSNERLEKILLATDFSDLSGAAEMVENLQREIRQLLVIRHQFQIYATELDEQSWHDLRNVMSELRNATNELLFTMKALTIGQRRFEDKREPSKNRGQLELFIRGHQIIAHLLLDDRTPFVDLAIANGTFRRLENTDGSNFNTIEVNMMQGINLLPDALYPELLSPYFAGMKDSDKKKKALRVYWYMLEAIGGIPVMDHFEINLIPMKLQLEHDTGQKLFQYIFPKESHSIGSEMSSAAPETNETSSSSSEEEDSSSDIILKVPHRVSSMNSLVRHGRSNTVSSVGSGSQTRGLRSLGSTEIPSLPKRPSLLRSPPSNGSVTSLSRMQGSTGSMINVASDTASVKSFVSTNSDFNRPSISRGFNETLMDDDLSEMVSRASKFITFVHVTIPSVVMCISYKGKGARNIEDVNDFVFRLPTLEYRNKTWSNLDLANHMKKD